jgi:uncharacterized membrane protein YedE/YeeE
VKKILAALASGALFGAGLALSGMTDPGRVIGFLDVAGEWDPTLALVMASALAVATPAFRLILGRERPLLDERFRLPVRVAIDRPLLAGAAVFGVGWGLAGLCPGPALAGLVTGSPLVALFVVAMVAGQWLAARVQPRG